MKYFALLMAIGIPSFANPVCDTIVECQNLQQDIINRLEELISIRKRKTTAGYTFTLVVDHPKLGIAWKDENGIIWGPKIEIARRRYWTTRVEAITWCNRIGARLPKLDDFKRLKKYLGENEIAGYVPEILHGLGPSEWALDRCDENHCFGWVFEGRTGEILRIKSGAETEEAFRCVVDH